MNCRLLAKYMNCGLRTCYFFYIAGPNSKVFPPWMNDGVISLRYIIWLRVTKLLHLPSSTLKQLFHGEEHTLAVINTVVLIKKVTTIFRLYIHWSSNYIKEKNYFLEAKVKLVKD